MIKLLMIIAIMSKGAPVASKEVISDGHKCMAKVLAHEARYEPLEGRRAIVALVLNRARQDWKRVCAVVAQKGQFPGVLNTPLPEKRSEIWFDVMSNGSGGAFMNATHYHNSSVRPYWSRQFEYLGKKGNHLFYRAENENYARN